MGSNCNYFGVSLNLGAFEGGDDTAVSLLT
jgi:hypothetical protein